MIENVSYSENINNLGGEGSSLPPSSKVKETVEVKTDMAQELKKQEVKQDNSTKAEIKEDVRVDPKELNEAIDRLNEKLYLTNREIVFKTEQKINKHYISVIDRDSQEIIKEWPPKEIRKFLIGLKELEDQLGTNKDIKNLIVNLEV